MGIERESILSLSPIKDLMKIDESIRVSDDAVISLRSAVELMAYDIAKKAQENTISDQRKTISDTDIEKALNAVNIQIDVIGAKERLALAQVGRILKYESTGMRTSQNALIYFRKVIENLIEALSTEAYSVAKEGGRKTIQLDDVLKITNKYVEVKLEGPTLDQILADWAIRNDIVKICEQFDIPTHRKYTRTLLRASMSVEEPPMVIKQVFSRDILRQIAASLKIPQSNSREKIIDTLVNRYTFVPFSLQELESLKDSGIEEKSGEIVQQEELDIEEGSIEGDFFQPSLKSFISESLTSDELKDIADLYSIDVPAVLETPAEIAEYLLSKGVSIVSFLRKTKVNKLRELLIQGNLKKSGNKTEIIFRILSLVSFIDYDSTQDDYILLRSDEKYMTERKAYMDPEEVISSYTGTARFDMLTALVNNGGKLDSSDLLDQYLSESDRHRVTFTPTIQALVRDKIVSKESSKEKEIYSIPSQQLPLIEKTVRNIQKTIKEMEGILDDLPGSRLNLLSLLCNYDEKRPVVDVKQEFKEFFTSPSTWNNSLNDLKQRDLVFHEYDDDLETEVIYTATHACPIISGLLPKYKEKLAEASAVEASVAEELTILQEMDDNGLHLIYIVKNSGGSMARNDLKTAYTTLPGIHFSTTTYYRYLKMALENGILKEEKEVIDDKERSYLVIPDNIKDTVVETIEQRLLSGDDELVEDLEGVSKNALVILKLITQKGGRMTYRDLRTEFTDRFSSEEFTRAFEQVDETFLLEGISEGGDQLVVMPENYFSAIEKFLDENDVTIPPVKERNLSAVDFLTNYGNPDVIRRISLSKEIDTERTVEEVIDDLLYSEGVSFKELIDKTVTKTELTLLLKKYSLKSSGNKEELIQRILDSGRIDIDEELLKSIDETI
ncbi:MAG: histone-like protein [Candidatus Odinarchaeota archaeon]